MSELLRADWLRYRRRRDFWIIEIVTCLLLGFGFLSAYRTDATDPPVLTPDQIREEIVQSTEFGGMTQAEIDAEIDLMVADQVAIDEQQRLDWERQQATALQKYDLPQSPFTLVGQGLIPLVALILVASLAVGDEFRFGTVRTSLLAAGDRRRFLAARLLTLLTMTVGLLGVLIALGLVLGLGLRLVGAEVRPASVPIDVASAAGWLAAQVLTIMVIVALATTLTLILRSGALPLILVVLAALVEATLGALPIFASGQPLAAVPRFLLTTGIRTLPVRLGAETHAVAFAGAEGAPAAVDMPTLALVLVVVAWGALFVALADRRIRTMDIVE